MKKGKDTVIYHPELSVFLDNCVIGDRCKIHAQVWIGNITIGNDTIIQAKAFIPDWISIGDNVFIGPCVCFTNDKHPPSKGRHWASTRVEDNVSIGGNVTILPGVTLGKGCRIGAGAVVTKSVPAGETWIGNPAKPYVSKSGGYTSEFDKELLP